MDAPSSSTGRRPPPPPPPRRQRRPSASDDEPRPQSPSTKPARPRLGPAPPPPEASHRRSPSPARLVMPLPVAGLGLQDPSRVGSPGGRSSPRLLSPVPLHSPLSLSPDGAFLPSPLAPSPLLSPPQQLPPELEPGVPSFPPLAPLPSPPRPPSPNPFSHSPSQRPPPLPPPARHSTNADAGPSQPQPQPQPHQTPKPPPPPITIPPPTQLGNPVSEAASLQGIPYPSEDMFLDSENLSTLEKIFLFARSDAAYHRLFVARTLPEWLPSVDSHEAVEYILPLLNGLGTDGEESVRETFAPSLARVMWYFFTTCTLTEDDPPMTPSVHSDEAAYPADPPLISVSSFTPLLGSLLLSVNRTVGESARWGLVQVLQKLKEEEEAENAPPPQEPVNRRKAKEAEKEKARKWEGWVPGRLGKEKRDMIRRELILGVVLGMARLEEEEEEAGGENGFAPEEMDQLSSAVLRETAYQKHGEDGEDGEEGEEEEEGLETVEEEVVGRDGALSEPGIVASADEEKEREEEHEGTPTEDPAVLPSILVPEGQDESSGECLEQTRQQVVLLAPGSTTFLLHSLSPRSISALVLPQETTPVVKHLPIPAVLPGSQSTTPTGNAAVFSAPLVASPAPLVTTPSPQGDDDTPAMSMAGSSGDSMNEFPAVPSGDQGVDDEDEGAKLMTPQAIGEIVDLVAVASQLGMARMSPEAAEAVSPLNGEDDDTPTRPPLTSSNSSSTAGNNTSSSASLTPKQGLEEDEEEDMDIVDGEETSSAPIISPPPPPRMPPEYFPSPPVNFPPPQQPVTPSLSPPDWLPVPPSPDAASPSQDMSARSSPLALIASLALMSAIASSSALPPPDLETHFLPELLRIAGQGDEWVRREAGFVIGALAKAVSPELVRAELVPLLVQFSNDAFWHVRHSSLFSAPPILSRLLPDERRSLVLGMFLAAAADPSRAVRSACLELVGEAIATFKDDELGPPEELVQLFLGNPNERPEDTDSDLDSPLEWFSTPGLGLKPVPTTKRDADRCLVCAFNFPAVAVTLGKDRWPELKDYYLYLARDKSMKVRRTLSSSLGALAEIIGPEAARRDLTGVWKRAFESTADGYVDEDVVGWAIESTEGLMRAIGGNFPREVLQWLQVWWTDVMARRWRLREQVAIKLPVLAQASASVDGAPDGVRILLGLALTDDVAAVRESAAEGVSGICAALRDGPGEVALRQELLNLSEHPFFRCRMTFMACVQSLLADEMKKELDFLWPRVWALGVDVVVDVRISVARLVAMACGMDTFFRDPTARPHLLNSLIRKLVNDKSYQVRSFVGFLRGTHTVTPVTTPVRGASLMSPSAKFSRPPLVLSPSGSLHEPDDIEDDRGPGEDDTKEFYSALVRRDAPLPVFTLPQSPRHLRKTETPTFEPRKESPEPDVDEEDPNDPFADFVSEQQSTSNDVDSEEDTRP